MDTLKGVELWLDAVVRALTWENIGKALPLLIVTVMVGGLMFSPDASAVFLPDYTADLETLLTEITAMIGDLFSFMMEVFMMILGPIIVIGLLKKFILMAVS